MNRKHRDISFILIHHNVVKGSNLYLNFYTKSDHTALAEMVKKLRKEWLISYDNCDLINSLYHSYSRISYKLAQGTSNKMGEEMLIFPKGLLFNEAISELSTPIFL